ncbi:MAG: hypothetical protein LIQ31_03990 [Planctomycetes bacterium]|nr:hypothetical protein [Planctomycetota bacterium]
MKWTCGCLFGVILVGGMGLVVLWLLLNRRDSSKSGWRHLPPGTIIAAEVHDVKGLLDHGFADPGLSGLLRRVIRPLLPADSPEGDTFQELIDAYQMTGFLYRMAAPNSGVVGECLDFPGERFFILQMPPWLRFLMNSSYPASLPHTYDADDIFLHFGHRDGFLVVAASPELVAEVLDNWDSGANPLGEPPDGDGPRLYVANRPESVIAESDGATGQPDHFMFADPFAPPDPGRQTAIGDANVPNAARLSLTPATTGWYVTGEIAPGTDWLGSADHGLNRSIRDVIGMDGRVYRGGNGTGLVARIDVTPEAMEYIRRASARYARDASFIPGEFRKDLAVKWLHDAWLASAGTVWHLAVTPAADHDADLPFPPLPVISLGWQVRDTTTPDAAGQAYATALAEWLDGLKTEHVGGGRVDLDSLIRYRLDQNDSGRGGRITLPSILVNGAAPAWRFNTASGEAWFATDPAGIPGEGGIDALPVRLSVPANMPAAGVQAVIQGEWTVDEPFLDDVFQFVLDRYSSLPERYRRDGQNSLSVVQQVYAIRQALSAYPTGMFTIHSDFDSARERFLFHIPYGQK